MDFHPTATDPTRTATLVCRNVRWNLLVMLAMFWALPSGLWAVDAPPWLVAIAAALPLLLTAPLLGAFRKRGRRENWTLAIDPCAVWLNLRDAEYCEAPSGDTIVSISHEEIASARRVTHRYTTPSGNGNTRMHRTVYLELRVEPRLVESIRDAIAAEWKRDLPQKQSFGGYVTTRTNRTRSPVMADGDDAIRVTFSAFSVALRPSIKRALAALATFTTVEPDESIVDADWRKLTDEELDQRVRHLAASGQRNDAMTLLRRCRGLSTSEAKAVLDELDQRAPAPAAALA